MDRKKLKAKKPSGTSVPPKKKKKKSSEETEAKVTLLITKDKEDAAYPLKYTPGIVCCFNKFILFPFS